MSKIILKISKKIFNLPFIGNKIKFVAKFTFNSINLTILTLKKTARIIFKLPRFFYQTLKIIIAIIRFNDADKNKIKIILHKVAKKIYYLPFVERYFLLKEELINDKFAVKKEIDNLIISTPIALREYKRQLTNLSDEINKLKAEKDFVNYEK
tara:strand:+ start:6439 stop:6897 length:459 start_codon:yes stop_codon:yes gene_type:complete